ncbi:MAG: hypothetical protein Q4E24_01615 [bacterium]|nr:hypothetical protein [bacterium]
MVVYDRYQRRFALKNPVKKVSDGAVYKLPNEYGKMVKIYNGNWRTPEKEREVVEAINGTGVMLGEVPVDVVYENGKFAGYILEEETTEEEKVEFSVGKQEAAKINAVAGIFISLATGGILSAVIYFLIFPVISKNMKAYTVTFSFDGIPMIMVGWIALLIAAYKTRVEGITSLIVCAFSYMIGAALIQLLIVLLVSLIQTAYAILAAVIPTILTAAILIWIVRAVFSR